MQLKEVASDNERLKQKMRVNGKSLAVLTDSTIINHLCIQNITNDMRKVNLIGFQTDYDLMMKDKIDLSIENGPKSRGHNHQVATMEKPILNIKAHINRNSNDTRAQTNFIREVKKACLDFKSSQI